MMETNTPEGKEEDESALAIKFGGPDDGEQTNLNLNEQNSSEDDEDAYAEEELEKPLPVRLRYDVSISVDDFRDKGTKKTLLSGAAGEAGPGDTLAVLGPSGSGKTTMLRVLSGRMVGYTGRVLLNEKSPTETTRNVLCFVQQEDLFIPSVTPREHLLFHARLRIENSIPVEEKIRRVNGLLAELGLKKCADTPIGGVGATVSGNISGGEKKRLSLATELLSRPSVIFADEVTSGLDSHMAETVVAKLRKLAQAGHTVLATIHQPSSYVFSGFNRVHLLSEGRTAYSGSAEAALEYFSSIGRPLPPLTNPADFYIKILSVGNTAAVLDAWEGSDFSKTLQLERLGSSRMSENRMSVLLKKQDFAAPWQLQFRELMRRTLLSYRRDAVLGRIRFAQALVLGTLVGAIYFHIGKSPISLGNAQSVNGALFYAILNQGLLGALGVIQVFPLEKPVFMRETSANAYSVSAYVLGKFFAEFSFQIVFPMVFAVIFYFMAGFQSQADIFFTFAMFVILAAMSAVSLGYLIGSVAPTVGAALALGPLLLMPLVIFGGLLINVDDIDPWFVWISYLSFVRYGFEGVMITIWENEGVIGESQLQFFAFNPDHKWRNAGLLCVLIVGFRLLSWIFLKFRSADKLKGN